MQKGELAFSPIARLSTLTLSDLTDHEILAEKRNGGALAIFGSTLKARRLNCISSTSFFGSGGCIYAEASLFECEMCTFLKNRAAFGGALLNRIIRGSHEQRSVDCERQSDVPCFFGPQLKCDSSRCLNREALWRSLYSFAPGRFIPRKKHFL